MPRIEGLYNVNIAERRALDYRRMPYEIAVDGSFEDQMAWLAEAAQGLDSPTIQAESGRFDDDEPMIVVAGSRAMTDAEVAEWSRQADFERRHREYMKGAPR